MPSAPYQPAVFGRNSFASILPKPCREKKRVGLGHWGHTFFSATKENMEEMKVPALKNLERHNPRPCPFHRKGSQGSSGHICL